MRLVVSPQTGTGGWGHSQPVEVQRPRQGPRDAAPVLLKADRKGRKGAASRSAHRPPATERTLWLVQETNRRKLLRPGGRGEEGFGTKAASTGRPCVTPAVRGRPDASGRAGAEGERCWVRQRREPPWRRSWREKQG